MLALAAATGLLGMGLVARGLLGADRPADLWIGLAVVLGVEGLFRAWCARVAVPPAR